MGALFTWAMTLVEPIRIASQNVRQAEPLSQPEKFRQPFLTFAARAVSSLPDHTAAFAPCRKQPKAGLVSELAFFELSIHVFDPR
jgi:hypothetical protein